MTTASKTEPSGLELLRKPFPANQISKLPKPYKKDSPKGNCSECGGYHGLPAAHLDYVGHAALTDRLLDADPAWFWEPLAFDAGLPAFDRSGGLWIKLTVCGVTRLGYGHAAPKSYGDPGMREKEVIGDALRNAAMRFGAALDLWHKGDLHLDDEGDAGEQGDRKADVPKGWKGEIPDAEWAQLVQLLDVTKADGKAMLGYFKVADLRKLNSTQYAEAVNILNAKLAKAAKEKTNAIADDLGDSIPY